MKKVALFITMSLEGDIADSKKRGAEQ